MKTGIELIAAERERQIAKEGWTPEHDDDHRRAEMALAARCYLVNAVDTIRDPDFKPQLPRPLGWPWEATWWKPSADPIKDLTKAGALIAAEIDRLNRQKSPTP